MRKPRESCFTRELVRDKHNLGLKGYPKSSTAPCHPCNERVCDFLGPMCGCKAPDCVDNVVN